MTGFAAARGGFGPWRWSAEIRSVNGRGLDLRLRLPDWVEGLEPELRRRLQARLGRGNVMVGIRLTRDEGAEGLRLSEAGLAAALATLARIEAAAHDAGVSIAGSSAAEVAAMRGVTETADAGEEDTEALRDAILADAVGLIEAFDADRAREGAALAGVIGAQIDAVAARAEEAAAAAGDRAETQRAALDRALARLLEAAEVPDEARLVQEMALIALKTDVTEELDRLTAHIAEARALLAAKGPVGRKFDFLMQEFNREANTLCAKSQNAALTAIGLELKTLVDQMREQVQNVE